MAQSAVKIFDETPTGEVLGEVEIVVLSEKITMRELIERRVRMEVEKFNAMQKETVFRGLVQPTDTEKVLNGYRMKNRRELDPDAQCAKALKGFEANGFFVLVDDRQVESLDEEIYLTPRTRVSFVKLVPLVGG